MITGAKKVCRACGRWRDRPCFGDRPADGKDPAIVGIWADLCGRDELISRLYHVPRGFIAWASFGAGVLAGLAGILARLAGRRAGALIGRFVAMETIADAAPWFLAIAGAVFLVAVTMT